MRQKTIRPIRNAVDLSDAEQVRAIRRRFGVSEDELARIVARIGNSIAVIGKEVALQRAAKLAQTSKAQAAPVALIDRGEEPPARSEKQTGLTC